MTGFDGKPKPFTTVDVIPVPHSMPSNTTDSFVEETISGGW